MLSLVLPNHLPLRNFLDDLVLWLAFVNIFPDIPEFLKNLCVFFRIWFHKLFEKGTTRQRSFLHIKVSVGFLLLPSSRTT